MDLNSLVYDLVGSHEILRAFELEKEGFPADEAASLNQLEFRQANADHLFFGAFVWRPPSQRNLVAFVCSTALSSTELTHDSMSSHDTSLSAKTVAIHSIVVDSAYKRQGLALRLLARYLEKLRADGQYDEVVLLSHAGLLPLYQKAGFQDCGISRVQHGSQPWHEMRCSLRSPTDSQSTFATSRLFSDLTKHEWLDDENLNKRKLLCPRRACETVLLNAKTAKLVVRSREALDNELARPTSSPPDFPPDTASYSRSLSFGAVTINEADGMIACWEVTPASPLTFENVGFSKSVGSLKYLTCANCDCGPLGWTDTKGRDLGKDVETILGERGDEKRENSANFGPEFFLDVRRVRYGM